MSITKNTIVSQPKDTFFTKVEDEIVVTGIDIGKYYGLNVVGSRIWELIKEPVKIETLCSKLLEEYNIDKESCLNETIALIEKLAKKNLVEIR